MFSFFNLQICEVFYKMARSIKQDKQRLAKKPGKRKSKNGKTYYESRPNRSDKNKRKRL